MNSFHPAFMTSLGRTLHRACAYSLSGLTLLTGVPRLSVAAEPSPAPSALRPPGDAFLRQPQPSVAVKTIAPVFAPPTSGITFSLNPTDDEFKRLRLFEEPLAPIDDKTLPEENKELAKALLNYSHDFRDYTPITEFLDSHPHSRWSPALQTDLGILYRDHAYWSKALSVWESAWPALKDFRTGSLKNLGDRTLGELAQLHSRLGHFDRIEALLNETAGRDIQGSGTDRVAGAREGLWLMKNRPGDAFRCGPLAVSKLFGLLNPGIPEPEAVANFKSTQLGTCLADLDVLATKVGLKYQVAFRQPGSVILYPSLIHWKVGHYAALVRPLGQDYLTQDLTFGRDTAATLEAIDQEASGYFLVAAGKLPPGWRSVSPEEASKVYGKGDANNAGPNAPEGDAPQEGGDAAGCGMASYSFSTGDVSLLLSDTPVFYSPPYGPMVAFHASYNHREIAASTNISNLGPKWSFQWSNYIMAPSTAATVSYGPGDGQLAYSNFNSSTGQFALQPMSGDILVMISATDYEMRHPDGSKEVFDLAETSANPRIFRTKSIDASGNVLTFAYDANYRLRTVTDAIGQVTVLDYNLSTDSTNPNFFKITKVTDPFGRFASFSYNTAGELASITDIIGITSQFTYSTGDFVTDLTTPYGNTHFDGADSQSDRWLQAIDPLGAKERVEWVEQSSVIPTTEPGPTVPTGFYNTNINFRNTFFWSKRAMALAPGDYTVAKITHWAHATSSDASIGSFTKESEKSLLENRVWYAYPGQTATIFMGTINSPSNVARVLDNGINQSTQYSYNTLGNIVQSKDPLNRTTTYNYFANGIDLQSVVQTVGAGTETISKFTYNAQHLPLTKTDAAGQTTTFTYNAVGQILTVQNPKNEVTTFAYQTNAALPGFGRVFTVTGPMAGAVTTFAYDAFGRVHTVTDSEGYVITTDYDAFNRPIKVTYPDGTYTQALYNRLDLEWTRDRLGRWSHELYNPLQQLVEHTDPAGRRTTYERCLCGALDAIVDASGNRTSWTRDSAGRVTQKVYPDGTYDGFAFENTTSRVKKKTDAKGQVTNYTYYTDDNVAALVYTDTAGAPLVPATAGVTYNYDSSYNRVKSMTDGVGTTTYTYNPVPVAPTLGAGQLASVAGPLTTETLAYTYDALGRVLTRSINGAANTVTNVYDSMGRLSGNTNLLGAFTYNYVNTTSRLLSVISPNGQSANFSYFGNTGDQRLQQIKNLGVGGTPPILSQFDYTYDPAGQILTWTQNYNGAPNPQRFEARYDAASQLTGATVKNATSGAVIQDWAYGYDASGNRTQEQNLANLTQAAYNTNNQLLSQNAGGAMEFSGTVTGTSTVTLAGQPAAVDTAGNWRGRAPVVAGANAIALVATDQNNNKANKTINVTVTGGASRALVYDLNGNLIDNGAGKTFAYDAVNRLVKITSSGSITDFVYDGQGHRTQEKLNSAVIKQWVWDSGPQLLEERDGSNTVTKRFFSEGQQISGNTFYYTTDHLGSVREMTDGTGAVRARYSYDPYGRITKVSGDLESDFGFTGFYRHQASGLSLTMYRAYDPDLGRWLSRDPKGEDGGLNLYGYVGNNPVMFIDPYGQVRWGQLSKGVGFIVGGVLATVTLSAVEVGSGGLATAGVVIAGTGVAGLYSYGIGNVVAAFSSDEKNAALMEGSPSSVPQLVARGIGGEPAQNSAALVESIVGINDAETALETAKASVEFADAEKSLLESLETQPNEADKGKKPCK